MIKNQNLALSIAAVTSLLIGGIAYAILGSDPWYLLLIEGAVIAIVFFILISVLPYTTSELADDTRKLRRATMLNETQVFISYFEQHRAKNPKVYRMMTEFLESAHLTIQKVTSPGEFEEVKLVKLHNILSRVYDIYQAYLKIVARPSISDDPEEFIKKFETSWLPLALEAMLTLERSESQE